jgi:hypothetical protein
VGEHGWEYRRRRPEETVLYEAVRNHLATLLAEAGELGRGLPRYVERDFTRYLECGVLAHGFARVRCESCKDELLVAFSCKGRGVCPSCNAKRAHVTAVHLGERVLPHVPCRQWTLSFPHRVRWVLLKDVGLLSDVLTLFLRAVFTLQRRRARRQGLRGGQVGAVSFVQFFVRVRRPPSGQERETPPSMFSVSRGGSAMRKKRRQEAWEQACEAWTWFLTHRYTARRHPKPGERKNARGQAREALRRCRRWLAECR